MKPRLFSLSALGLIVIGLLLAPSPARAQVKPIRLRNGVIPAQASQPASNQAKSALAQPPVSGLFLVQFSSPPGREARDQLAAIGVDLLHYVPEDTFVARLRGVSLDRVRTAPLVQWIGEYHPAYKIHPRLAAAARAAILTNQVVAVNALIAPQATPDEIAEVRSLFLTIAHESKLRQGTILQGGLAPVRLNALCFAAARFTMSPGGCGVRVRRPTPSRPTLGTPSGFVV